MPYREIDDRLRDLEAGFAEMREEQIRVESRLRTAVVMGLAGMATAMVAAMALALVSLGCRP
jgi:hypothetical protein